jgi:hypothetical protein
MLGPANEPVREDGACLEVPAVFVSFLSDFCAYLSAASFLESALPPL